VVALKLDLWRGGVKELSPASFNAQMSFCDEFANGFAAVMGFERLA